MPTPFFLVLPTIGLERTGYWFPVPTVRLQYPFPSGKVIEYEQPIDILRTATVVTVAQAPTVDGKVGKEEWQGATVIDEFGNQQGQPTRAEPTKVLLLRHAKMLYVAALCTDSQLDQIKAKCAERDGRVTYDDRIGMILAPGNGKLFWFYVNPKGAIWDLVIDLETNKTDMSWDGDFKIATSRAGNRWIVEMAISLEQLAGGPPPDTWRFNIRRKQHRAQQEAVFEPGWCPYNPDRYGYLEFVKSD